MGLFRKLQRQVKSAARSRISPATTGTPGDPVGDARRRVDELLDDLRDEMDRVQVSLAEQRRTADDLGARAEADRRLAERRKEQALAALQQGDEETARRAVRDGEVVSRRALEAERMWREAQDSALQLAARLETLRLQYLDLQRRRDELSARADLAELDRQLADVQSGIDRRATELDRLEQAVRDRELEAEAHREVADLTEPAGVHGSADPAAPRADVSESEVDERLEALRRQLAGGG